MGYGPIQMLVVGFDGNRFRGEIWPELERLKREGVVRIIDLMLVRKDEAGAVTHIVASDLDWEEAAQFGEAMPPPLNPAPSPKPTPHCLPLPAVRTVNVLPGVTARVPSTTAPRPALGASR